MPTYELHFRTNRYVGSLLAAAAACLTVYIGVIRPASNSKRGPSVLRARTGTIVSSSSEKTPYPPDVFPGARDVDTAYGSIRVFEWGPEDGEKVVLLHGIGTPCVALGGMAEEFVRKGCRVILFDLFGRGYSDGPADLPYDDRLYTTQLLLVLAASPISWTGPSAFHLLGYSLGGGLAASFTARHPHLVRSLTLICPGGLIRSSHVSWRSKLLYSEGLLPEWLLTWLARRRLEPGSAAPSADVPDGEDADVDFDEVPVAGGATVGEVVKWQLHGNDGFVRAYMSTLRRAPIYGHHQGIWKLLSAELLKRRAVSEPPPGLEGGKLCLILAERDPIVVKDEWIEDSKTVLGEDGVDIHVMEGGHEIAIAKGTEVANIAMSAWERNRLHRNSRL